MSELSYGARLAKKQQRPARLILSVILSIGGVVAVSYAAGWLTAIGLILLIWGNNIERSTRE